MVAIRLKSVLENQVEQSALTERKTLSDASVGIRGGMVKGNGHSPLGEAIVGDFHRTGIPGGNSQHLGWQESGQIIG